MQSTNKIRKSGCSFIRRTTTMMTVLTLCALTVLARDGKNLIIKVTDKETSAPVEYAHIVMKKALTGTIADGNGVALLSLPKAATDTMKVSCIGFGTVEAVLTPDIMSKDTLTVALGKKTYAFPDVVVRPPKKVRNRTVGKRHASGMVAAFADTVNAKGSGIGWEVGKKGHRTYLSSWGFHIKTDTITETREGVTRKIYPLSSFNYRINIYDASEAVTLPDMTKSNYIPVQSVLVRYTLDMVKNNKFTWVFPEPILLPEKALVEIELLDAYHDNERIYFRSNVYGKMAMFRLSLKYDDSWIELPIAIPFFLNLRDESF